MAARNNRGMAKCDSSEPRIASRLGEGTKVTVRMPVDCESARPPRDAAKVGHPSFERLIVAPAFQPEAQSEIQVKKSA